MDEYEALRTIVSENPGLMNRVLEKIRVHRAMNSSDNDPLNKAAEDKKNPKDKKEKK